MVTIMQINQKFLPGNLSLARPNATIAEDKATPIVDTPAMSKELPKYTPKLIPAKPLHPFT